MVLPFCLRTPPASPSRGYSDSGAVPRILMVGGYTALTLLVLHQFAHRIEENLLRDFVDQAAIAWTLLNLGAILFFACRQGATVRRLLVCGSIGLSFLGVAWSCEWLAARWHREFAQHYDNYFHAKVFTTVADMDPEVIQICVCDNRYYPFFGSRRQFHVCRPLWVPTRPRFVEYLEQHQATLVAARHNDFSSQLRYEEVSGWLTADAEAFPLLSEDSTYLLVRVRQGSLPSRAERAGRNPTFCLALTELHR